MTDKKAKFGDMDNLLLMVEHPEYGIWYFSSVYLAAKWMGLSDEVLWVWLHHNKNEFSSWKFEWVDGSNVMEKYINPR